MKLVILYALLIIVALNCLLWSIHLISNLISGVPTLSSGRKLRKRVVQLGYWSPTSRVVDLGCGTGKLLAELVRTHHLTAVGYEINFTAYLLASLRARLVNWQARRQHHAGRLTIYCRSFFKADLSSYNFVFMYLMPELMERVRQHLNTSARPGTIVLTNSFHPQNVIPAKVYIDKQVGNIYVYHTPLLTTPTTASSRSSSQSE